jgi:hypothetical protein
MPPGSYATGLRIGSTTGFRQVIFASKGSLQDFVRFVSAEWPKHGWRLGRGESEPGEAEDQFYKPATKVLGAFRAGVFFCDQKWTWVYIIFGKQRAPGPFPSASPSPRTS